MYFFILYITSNNKCTFILFGAHARVFKNVYCYTRFGRPAGIFSAFLGNESGSCTAAAAPACYLFIKLSN